MRIFKNLKGHFSTITHHKMLVMKTCFKVGLYKQGLLHDLSKYTPIEFIPGVIYYQGDRSPINREKELKTCSRGWLHHKGRNLHHFEYWIDYSINPTGGKLVGMKMPKKYVAEMVIDRISASKNYRGIRFAYEEMAKTCNEMQSGVTELESYEQFGKRCGLKAYRKLAALLTQNLRKGSKGLSELLRTEADQAFEERKAAAKKRGEEAGTKLLLPKIGRAHV